MDFSKLRAAALRDGDDEEAVTVNTRALIDKVLARYSGEWTTLRELIQNAADAQATKVTIKFETLPSAQVPLSNTTSPSEILKHVLINHTLKRLVVTNNGQAFGVNDWARLKRIAEGNPDETKIGAFGVGFYSVFADCEEPFVISGDQSMAFYWKSNSLFTRRFQQPAGQASTDTSFVLDYRNTTTPMPNLLSIAQFLATSLTFVALEALELFVDDWKIVSLQKKRAPSIQVPLVRDVETKTKEGMMQIVSMDRESVQMDATFMNVVGWKPTMSASISKAGGDQGYGSGSSEAPSLRSFFSRLTSATGAQLKTKAMKEEQEFQDIVLEDLTATTTANVFLRVTTAGVKTFVSSQFAAELERATKKPPPKTTKLAILTSSFDEIAASTDANAVAKRVDIFASVLPSKKPGGRIFIGFPTHQTTGAGMHLSAPSVIPTVERESIDLNARWVRTWNQEMLRVAGIMARLAFTDEMSDLSQKVQRATKAAGSGSKVTKEVVAALLPEALHILNTFTFSESTPSSQVSQLIMESFWTAYKKASIEIFSTRGVLPTTKVRLATDDLSGFVDSIPVIPDQLVEIAFVKMLKSYGLLEEITIGDVQQELSAKALNSEQLLKLIAWAGSKAAKGTIDMPTVKSLFDVVVATVGEHEGEIITLGTVKNYLNVSIIPPDVPIPPTTIPFPFSKTVPVVELQALGWTSLEIVSWLRFLVETNSSRGAELSLTNPAFAARTLAILSKAWEPLSQVSKDAVVQILKNITIIPTKFGMRKPAEAFFPNVKLFEDLPTYTSCQGVKEKFMAALGVRKTVDLETIFSRLLSPSATAKEGEIATKVRHVEVIKYLASVAADIPAVDLKRLRESPICPAEAGPEGREQDTGTAKLYRVSELFTPTDNHRKLKLHIIQWPSSSGNFMYQSLEGKFLTKLGLRAEPTVPELIDMMASSDSSLGNKAMVYFISHHQINRYDAFNVGTSRKSFLPIQNSQKLVSPVECFTNPKSAILGFNVLVPGLVLHANKFGVADNPPMTECVNRIIAKPPQSRQEAIDLFNYFSSRLGEIGSNSVGKLENARIVPVVNRSKTSDEKGASSSAMRLLTPQQCYLGDSVTYRDFFDFVDFGKDANTFLLKCGSKNEPTNRELAALACKEPAHLLTLLVTPEKYMGMLKSLAVELADLKRDKELFKQMKTSKWLIGSVEIPAKKENRKSKLFGQGEEASDDEIEEDSIKTWQLVSPSQAVVVDDYSSFRIFKDSLICAPTDDALESFYLSLGAPNLGSLVEDATRLGGAIEKQDSILKLRSHILERAKLFLHDGARSGIKHDARWLEKNLSLQAVSSIQVRKTLRGHTLSHTDKRTAHIQEERHKGWILYVVPGKNVDSYQISQCICKVLLEYPNQQSFLTFESFYNLSLYQLRSRGYNVERILRAKAAEERIAEEERKKQLEAEQQYIRAQEQQWRQQNETSAVTARQARDKIPGGFESEPDSPEPAPKTKSRSMFSGLTRRLGLGEDNRMQDQLQSFLGGGTHAHPEPLQESPPSYDDITKPKKDVEKVSSPAATQQNLLNAIQSSRAHDSSTLFSPPTTNNVKEQATYCDATPSTNITYLADATNGTRMFVSRDLSIPAANFLAQNSAALNMFAGLLHEVADVYNLPRRSVHVFYDEAGGTIAFNSNGSIFANFRFFAQLHQNNLVGTGKVEAVAYWWIVIAHEIAHNLIKAHNSEHSYYTEMLVANHFPKMMAKAMDYMRAPENRRRIEG